MIAEELIDNHLYETEYQWKKTPRGYRLPNGFAELVQRDNHWYLLVRELGITLDIGRSPSFGKANRELDRIVNSDTQQLGTTGPSKLSRRFR
jgi:hypothetical protein